MNLLFGILVLGLALLKADPALACAVCGIGEDESTGAFMISTAMLTFTPLFALGGIGYFVYRRFNPSTKSWRLSMKEAFANRKQKRGESSTAGDKA